MHKMFENAIALCLKACEDQCCTFDDCPLFEQCFPDAYKSWQRKVKEEKRAGQGNIIAECVPNKK